MHSLHMYYYWVTQLTPVWIVHDAYGRKHWADHNQMIRFFESDMDVG